MQSHRLVGAWAGMIGSLSGWARQDRFDKSVLHALTPGARVHVCIPRRIWPAFFAITK